MFSNLGEVAFCRKCLMCLSSTLTSRHQCYMLLGCPLCGLCGSFYCGGLNTVDGLVGMAVPTPSPASVIWLPGLLCAETAGSWWTGLGHKAAGCSALGGPGASAGPLVGGPGIQCLWGWGSWIECWLAGGQSQFMMHLTECPGVSQNAFSPLVSGAGSQDSWLRGPRCLRTGVSLR